MVDTSCLYLNDKFVASSYQFAINLYTVAKFTYIAIANRSTRMK